MTDDTGLPAAEHSERCRDCDAAVGEAHQPICWTARCLATGLRRIDCPVKHDPTITHDCGRDLWTGWWPGEIECQQFGWMLPPGVPDLNRLYTEAVWDPDRCQWVKPT